MRSLDIPTLLRELSEAYSLLCGFYAHIEMDEGDHQ
jgi:hypothetical protein